MKVWKDMNTTITNNNKSPILNQKFYTVMQLLVNNIVYAS